MPQYDETNRGALFKNDRKETEDHPDYKGSIDVDGTKYWISAWIKESKKDGTKFMSLSVSRKQERPRQERLQPDNEDIPF